MRLTHSFSSIKLYENCPQRYFLQRVTKQVADEGGDASKYGERIHAHLEKRLKENTLLPQEAAHYEPLCMAVERIAHKGELLVENQMTLTENLTPTTWFASDAWLRSILDILVLQGDHAVVMDWKTGKRRPDFTQLEMFALQVFKHYPEVERVTTSLVWLKDMSMDTEIFNRGQANEMWAKLMGRIQRIHDSLEHDNWPAKPSGLCRFCPARHMCDHAKL